MQKHFFLKGKELGTTPVVLPTQEAKAGKLPESKSLRTAWAI
jgi:hypothetical protein